MKPLFPEYMFYLEINNDSEYMPGWEMFDCIHIGRSINSKHKLMIRLVRQLLWIRRGIALNVLFG